MPEMNGRHKGAELEDGRGDAQIVFIPHEVDDMEISPAAFRVYFHLVKTNRRGEVSSSYQAIGDKCFGSQHPKNEVTRRQCAIVAVNELIELGLLKKPSIDNPQSDCLMELILTGKNSPN